MRTPVKLNLPQGNDERRLLRARLLVQLHASITKILMDISPGLTIDEMLVREAVYVAEFRSEECDLDHVAGRVGISMTSATRKLSKLVSMGLIEKKKQGRKYVYSTPEKILGAQYEYSDGRPVVDDAVDQVIDLVDKLIR